MSPANVGSAQLKENEKLRVDAAKRKLQKEQEQKTAKLLSQLNKKKLGKNCSKRKSRVK